MFYSTANWHLLTLKLQLQSQKYSQTHHFSPKITQKTSKNKESETFYSFRKHISSSSANISLKFWSWTMKSVLYWMRNEHKWTDTWRPGESFRYFLSTAVSVTLNQQSSKFFLPEPGVCAVFSLVAYRFNWSPERARSAWLCGVIKLRFRRRHSRIVHLPDVLPSVRESLLYNLSPLSMWLNPDLKEKLTDWTLAVMGKPRGSRLGGMDGSRGEGRS